MLIYNWRTGKLHAPRDPPFNRPVSTVDMDHDEDDGDEESSYHLPPARTTAPPVSTNFGSSFTASSNTNPASPFADSNRYSGASVGRPSMETYGAFSDPAPSGFTGTTSTYSTPGNNTGYTTPPRLPEPDFGSGISSGPAVSRTMQYADPYAADRANITTPATQTRSQSTLPDYESYQGYR